MGIATQNVLAVCDFDMRFTYVSVGNPGAMHDTSVLYNALRVDEDFFRNVIERSFGLLKMKWPILWKIPPYPMYKQKNDCCGYHDPSQFHS
jgi:hypothetical protein